ncbi:MAG: helix-turn-helix domain-containing protein [Rhizonema sp. NSF051]|nr:helix-turn-helix domain-containing protein [Rhizonema sp. NSF051]
MRKEFLDQNHHYAITLLAAGYTNEEVARKTGVSSRTIGHWKKRDDFANLLRQATAATYDAAVAELVSGSRAAAQELKRLIDDPDTPSRVKVSAIQVLLSNAAKAKDTVLQERLERVENLLDDENLEETITIDADIIKDSED